MTGSPSPTLFPSVAGGGNLHHISDVQDALQALGLPAFDMEVLVAISRTCRSEFVTAIQICRAGLDKDGSQREFLDVMAACCSESARLTLHKIQCAPSPDDLVNAALHRPKRIKSALALIDNTPEDIRRPDAIAFLQQLFSEKGSKQISAATGRAAPKRITISSPSPTPAGSQSISTHHPRTPDNKDGRQYRSVHVFGSDCALCFNASYDRDGSPSVLIDGAALMGRQADWNNSLHFMLDVPEISGVLAVLRKLRPRVEFKFHGKARDKSFAIEHQGTHLFARLSKISDPKIIRAVKMSLPEAFKLSLLLVEQLVLAHPTLPPDLVLELALSVTEPIDAAK